MTWLALVLGLPQAAGDTRLLVGVEDDPEDGSLRVYLNARYTGIHTHIDDPEARKQLMPMPAPHVFIDVPDSALCNCHPELTPALNKGKEGTDVSSSDTP